MAPTASAKPKAKSRRRKKQTSHGFEAFSMHCAEPEGHRAFAKLDAERSTFAAFSLDSAKPEEIDPESAAKRLLLQALGSDSVRGLTAPRIDNTESEFKSLGVETVPLTHSSVVKFRQHLRGVPVYGSLVSVELGDDNELISINSTLAVPDVGAHIAKVSPEEAMRVVAKEAGYGRHTPPATPVLNYYLDAKDKWHLAYIVNNVPNYKAGPHKKTGEGEHTPLIFDYVVDALTGKLIAKLPRTASARLTDKGLDEQGIIQKFLVEVSGRRRRMRNAVLNIETYDFGFGNARTEFYKLPGTLVEAPWSTAAVSAHANAAFVANYLRTVLKRNNIDNKGGRVISSVNCVDSDDPSEGNIWENAVWNGKQMIYGQVNFNGSLRSLASSLDVVAHEMFHGVTMATAGLEYEHEPGALNESYSDIFAILISNSLEPDIGKWNWQIADGVTSGQAAFRDMEDPTRHKHPKHMRNYKFMKNDHGGVHINSGIHNYAAFKIMTAKDGRGAFIFKPEELAAMFYVALTQLLSRQSTFSHSRRAVVSVARSLFRDLQPASLGKRIAALEKGFGAAGIV